MSRLFYITLLLIVVTASAAPLRCRRKSDDLIKLAPTELTYKCQPSVFKSDAKEVVVAIIETPLSHIEEDTNVNVEGSGED
ncbi:unnamed protein product [Bursaphelenchus okinawaensis]|uniref:Uncharacterized protein n=1 Tax=Bursaphelenchus okinawaensis TaxID=465554 RepID=A0A811JVX9_9BILA|nr:unnamed protein product [Bursaphelenchus okinawaensis]CAG9085549.1 unnamed protein product [Bursaphelenchus okinawaensis]